MLGEKGSEPWAGQIFHKCSTQLNMNFKENKAPSLSVLLRVKPRTSHTLDTALPLNYTPHPGPKSFFVVLKMQLYSKY